MFHVKLSLLCLVLIVLGISLNASNRMVAEWEPQRGTLVRYPFGIPASLVTSLTVQDTLYILVADNNAYNNAIGVLSSWGANLNHCRFIFAPTNSHWTRDWGPQSVFIDGATFGIVDPIFSGYPWVPGRKDIELRYTYDNAVNQILSAYFGVPRVPFSGYLTGGNVMYDGYGTAFSTAQMIVENFTLMSSEAFLALADSVLGVHNYHFTINPEIYGIQHIDCWAKLLNEETVMVKQLPQGHPEYDRAENIAQQFARTMNVWNKPYRVVRIFCGTYSGNSAAAYTNSYILNGRVFVPLFNIASDAAAIQTYQDAMPGYEVIGIPWSSWYYYDALHCRVMGIGDGEMLRLTHVPPPDTTYAGSDAYSREVKIKSYGQHALIANDLLFHYRIRPANQWQSIPLEPTADPQLYRATVVGIDYGQTLEYYFTALDVSGRAASAPHNAPHRFYKTTIIHDTSSPYSAPATPIPRIYPNPTQGNLTVRWDNAPRQSYRLKVYNIKGQLVHSGLVDSGNKQEVIALNDLPVGVYIYSIMVSGSDSRHIARGKLVIVGKP